ncbi:hypothetical protein OG225_17295 [Nocardia sp. NBC_01377]|uniref:DUF7802 domain-containing protein n=1 Tax=Nocardia sp. NBC_01377 TaxID=2903595 RepID=UPI003244270E
MAEQCNPIFDSIARSLGGFSCHDAAAVVDFRNPFGLSNWTLPIIEWMMVLGAVLALVHAFRRLRRDGDPTNLALWFAPIIYSLVIEIPEYFPNIFHLEDTVGVIFAHNVFTVQFLFDRLPLYIVALYPALTTLAYEIVRSLGVFQRRRGILIGAVCVGFVHHVLYEIFDQLGPQLRWWAWNTDNKTNHPMLSSVPMTSVFMFATVGPAVVVFLVRTLVTRRVQRGPRPGRAQLVLRTVLAGILVPVGVTIFSMPSQIFGGDDPNTTAQAFVLSLELAVFAAIAIPVLTQQWLLARRDAPDGIEIPNRFVATFGSIYLVTMLVLWIGALPDYFDATAGRTSDGTPTGNLLYAAVCIVLAALCVAAAAGVTIHRNNTAEKPRAPRVEA